MRIISGSLRGREIEGFNIVGTRPTMDRIKESIFAMIQGRINNSVVLDLFAGSGNYGLEALSNGALFVYFNDHNPKCVKIITKNLTKFQKLDYAKVTNYDYLKALDYYQKASLHFDLIFLDPPYKERIHEAIIEKILFYDLLNNHGLIICEVTIPINICDSRLILLKARRYGDKQVFIYQLAKAC